MPFEFRGGENFRKKLTDWGYPSRKGMRMKRKSVKCGIIS